MVKPRHLDGFATLGTFRMFRQSHTKLAHVYIWWCQFQHICGYANYIFLWCCFVSIPCRMPSQRALNLVAKSCFFFFLLPCCSGNQAVTSCVYDNQVSVLDMGTMGWTTPAIEGDLPNARSVSAFPLFFANTNTKKDSICCKKCVDCSCSFPLLSSCRTLRLRTTVKTVGCSCLVGGVGNGTAT